MHRPSALLGSCFVALLALVGCGQGLVLPTDGAPAELRLIHGDDQAGAAGAPLPDSLEVLVLDSRGNPLPRQTVSFRLESALPSARVSPENATTRPDGTARALWVLGATSGIQEVVAQVARAGTEPLEVRFSAIVGAAGAQRIAIADGNEQSGPVGSPLGNPLVVLVTDGFGNPVAGIPVDWDAQDGTTDPGSSITGPDGKAQTSWTLGSSTGTQSASASSGNLTPVAFTATARPGSPNRLERVSGNDQSADPGEELSDPLVVRLLDEAGNGVPNRAVSWVVASGGGSVSSATSTTDENGRASTRWTLGGSEGANTLNAVVSGVGVVAFSATADEDGGGGGGGSTASRLEFRVQPSDTEEGETMDPSVEVVVEDESGNPVTDREFEIKLELLDRRGRVRADGTVTTRSGVATFDIRIDRDGEYRLRASTDGLPSVESDRFEIEDD